MCVGMCVCAVAAVLQERLGWVLRICFLLQIMPEFQELLSLHMYPISVMCMVWGGKEVGDLSTG